MPLSDSYKDFPEERNRNRNKPNIRCEECGKELEYLDENLDITICSECIITYDLKIYKFSKRKEK